MGFSETEIAKIEVGDTLFRVTHESRKLPNKIIGRLYMFSNGEWNKLEEWEPEWRNDLSPHMTHSDWATAIRDEAKEQIKVYETGEQDVIKTTDPTNEY